MTDEQTISWIFLSTALASQIEPTDFKGICSIADGINQAVPTYKELHNSLTWLAKHDLIKKQGKKITLTDNGKQEYIQASQETNILFEIWSKLEKKIKNHA